MMKYSGWIIAAILLVTVSLVYAGGPIANVLAGVIVVIVILLPPKWDPAIKFKERNDSKKDKFNG